MTSFHSAILAALLISSTAHAEAPYIDDRSSPTTLVQSLYSAINRKEFARAWEYFSEKPSKDFESFVKGYENTGPIDLQTGGVTSEGAAGSVFHSVPVAIQVFGDAEAMFAGCYDIREVRAANQSPPFKSLAITKGKLKKIEPTQLAEALPEQCDGVPVVEFQRGLLARATEIFERDYGQICPLVSNPVPDTSVPEIHLIDYRYEGAAPSDPPQQYFVMSFPCMLAAYNSIEVYYGWEPIYGFRQLHFAMPDFDIKYEDEESKKLKSITVSGFTSAPELANSTFDPKTDSISMFSKWRGLGDAGANGTWVFRDGRFVLDTYDVDPTYDEEIEAVTVIKAGKVVLQ
jgi:hypothetical protein